MSRVVIRAAHKPHERPTPARAPFPETFFELDVGELRAVSGLQNARVDVAGSTAEEAAMNSMVATS
jgi:hypothetical protein